MQSEAAAPRNRSLIRRAFVLKADDLGGRVVRGASYKFLNMGVRIIVTLGSTAILARILTPADYGYIAMAAVVTEFAALFGQFGFTDVLIQRKAICRLQLDTVFWISLTIGSILALSVLLLSFGAGRFFGDPQVGSLLRVLCIPFILNSLNAVPGVVLSRMLRFRTEFWIQIVTATTGAVVSLFCAYRGYGVWSLVAGSVSGSLASVLMNFAAVAYVPRLRFQSSYLAATWKTSSFYFAGSLVYYLNMSVDLILVGKYMGATSLGLYQNARSLTDEIRARLAAPLAQTLFPAFSAVQAEASHSRHLFMRSGRLLATAIFLLGFGVSATAPELVELLYGSKWLKMIPLVTLFGISAAFRGSTALVSPLLNANNRVGLMLRYHIVGTAAMVVGVGIAIKFDIEAVAMAVAVASLYPLVAYYAAIRILGLDLADMYRTMGPPAISAAMMWAGIAVLRPVLRDKIENLVLSLLILSTIGFLIYAAILLVISRQHITDARDVVAKL
jgi:O-antigen/teichoic acid export membrane protein